MRYHVNELQNDWLTSELHHKKMLAASLSTNIASIIIAQQTAVIAAISASNIEKLHTAPMGIERINKEQRSITMSLDTIEAIHKRYSCRAFSDRMPSDANLKIIAKAAAASPSGMNRQLWRIIVVKNKKLISDMEAEGMKILASFSDKGMYNRIMSRGGKLYYNAPCMIVVPIAKTEPAGAELFDCGIVSENIALAATSLGIDSLICGLAAFSFAGEKGAEFKQRLGFPEGYEIGIAVLLGYAANPGGKPHELDPGKITVIE